MEEVDLGEDPLNKPIGEGDGNVLNDGWEHLLDDGDEINTEVVDEQIEGGVVIHGLLDIHDIGLGASVVLAEHVVLHLIIHSAIPRGLLLEGHAILMLEKGDLLAVEVLAGIHRSAT